jgi:hypothetical protein
MTEISVIGLMVGLMLEILGIGSGVKLHVGKAVVSMSLGGFIIAASLGLLVL